jgi:hypothetical protein
MLLMAIPVGRGQAQHASVPDTRPWYVTAAHWGRWPTLAAAIGFTAGAIAKKGDADEVYDGLQAYCVEDSSRCLLNAQGQYANPEAEARYQETLRLDAQARRWMLGGQGFLFLSGAFFLIDLATGSSKPENIPLTPLEAFATPGAMGLRWRF